MPAVWNARPASVLVKAELPSLPANPGADIIPGFVNGVDHMNRQKKLQQLFKARAKKASAKLAPKSKDRYISKADRLKLAAESGEDAAVVQE